MSEQAGILTYRVLHHLVETEVVRADHSITPVQYQPASLDLRLGRVAYRIRSSFVPGNLSVEEVLRDLQMYTIDLDANGILEKNQVYLVPLEESLCLPQYLRARANPKSTTGRLDMLTRVISDYNARFDDIQAGYCGKLYLEIVPKSFTISVKPGLCLNQLRFIQGECLLDDQELAAVYQRIPLLYDSADDPIPPDSACIQEGLLMRVDLQGERNQSIIGYKARKNSDIIDLTRIHTYEISDFWEPIQRQKNDQLILEPEEFHLLCSQEKVRIPPDYSAEMVAYDIGAGEFRVHYAGFFDPGFGYGNGDIPGTYAVLEVRSHDVPYRISHGQPFCKIQYARNIERPEVVYGIDLGSNYQRQKLSLSKQFKQ
ncbi:2'-deoxycytidine 5'-triphosphate deaminase [Candidatus Vecturithrix granuli]|uniref:2'-deoxycytidine 5'-triphosphate deaminase n=1 Tax=Vecturithrix granuli TaxID=1499967 RepID=A0A081C099_VECG1|nr:2'-deoxycytidine 5'-triphosphate deaminase [Candidatus Vecturithrix granuli]